ncbi:uncharacterized protein BKA78DRAFT_328773 [Phyllosticta capitalensis]|uniref:uncharacterized protein n=1 Tax=Phyllosticta capitalensis TaxID=121624 RepID=UPI00312E38F8
MLTPAPSSWALASPALEVEPSLRIVRHLGLKFVAGVVALVQHIGAVADFARPVLASLVRSGPALGSLFSHVLIVLETVHSLVQGLEVTRRTRACDHSWKTHNRSFLRTIKAEWLDECKKIV